MKNITSQRFPLAAVPRIVRMAACPGLLFAMTLVAALQTSIAAAAQGVASDLKRELALAKKVGLPTTPSEMKRPSLPAEKNAATYYLKLDQWMRHDRTQPGEPLEGELLLQIKPDANTLVRGRRRIAQQREVLQLIHSATDRSACDFQKNWALGAAVMFPEFSRMRSATRLLMDEAAVMLWDGKPIEAARNMARGFKIARHANAGQTFIAHLVAVAIDAITLAGMERILYQAGDQPGVAAEVRSLIANSFAPPSLAEALRGELVMGLATIDDVRKGGLSALASATSTSASAPAPSAKPMTPEERKKFYETMDLNAAALIRAMRIAYPAADGPFPSARQVLERASVIPGNGKDPRYAMMAILLPLYAKSADKRAMATAKAQVCRAAAAILAWKRSHGSFPDSLKQAVGQQVVDPFDMRPLRYRRLAGRFFVWSVGENGKFGGLTGSRKDYRQQAVFQWPMPEMLKSRP